MNDKAFEIPGSVRDMAEKSVDQAKSAYDQFMDASRKAQAMVEQSSGSVLESSKEIQQKAQNFTEQNMKAGFDLAEKLISAKDFAEALELQSSFAQRQMETYSRQAQELTSAMAEAAKKAQSK